MNGRMKFSIYDAKPGDLIWQEMPPNPPADFHLILEVHPNMMETKYHHGVVTIVTYSLDGNERLTMVFDPKTANYWFWTSPLNP